MKGPYLWERALSRYRMKNINFFAEGPIGRKRALLVGKGPSSRYMVKYNNFFAEGPISRKWGPRPHIGKKLISEIVHLHNTTLWKAPIYENGSLSRYRMKNINFFV